MTIPLQPNEQLAFVVVDKGGWFDVWVSLPGHDPLVDVFGFIIGTGDTLDGALADAVQALEDALERLQGPPGAGYELRRVPS